MSNFPPSSPCHLSSPGGGCRATGKSLFLRAKGNPSCPKSRRGHPELLVGVNHSPERSSEAARSSEPPARPAGNWKKSRFRTARPAPAEILAGRPAAGQPTLAGIPAKIRKKSCISTYSNRLDHLKISFPSRKRKSFMPEISPRPFGAARGSKSLAGGLFGSRPKH